MMKTASALSDPSEHVYGPLSLVVLVPCTTREQCVSLLSAVVVKLGCVGVHPATLISDPLYDHDIEDVLEKHSRMNGSSGSPMAFSGFRMSAPAAATNRHIANKFTKVSTENS